MNCFQATSRFISYFSSLNDVLANLSDLLFINILHCVVFMPLLCVPMPGMHLLCPSPPCQGLQFQVLPLFQSSLKCHLLQAYFESFSSELKQPFLPTFKNVIYHRVYGVIVIHKHAFYSTYSLKKTGPMSDSTLYTAQ